DGVRTERQRRGMAGLWMGGNETVNIAIPNLQKFAHVGVFSSGIIDGGRRGTPAPADTAPPVGVAWEKQNAAALDNAANKRGLRLFWFSTGKEDFLLSTTRGTDDLFKRHGFNPVLIESEGAHTW